jgi:hypothetical protein
MDNEKLYQLICNILDLKYPKTSLQNVNQFQAKLAADLGTSPEEAMTMLGYLISGDYVRIVSDMGIVVNPSSPELKILVEKYKLKKG